MLRIESFDCLKNFANWNLTNCGVAIFLHNPDISNVFLRLSSQLTTGILQLINTSNR